MQWEILCIEIVLQRETRFRSHNKTMCEETMLSAINLLLYFQCFPPAIDYYTVSSINVTL